MLLVDDLLLAPIHGLLWIFGKIHDAAQEEIAGEADAITEELRELYMMLETGKVTEAEFDARERTLLDRLEAVQARESEPEEEEEEEGEVDEEDDEDDEDDGEEE
ncbi:MAG: gas vesicle protein GvpG [candidate division NC10 bacterium]